MTHSLGILRVEKTSNYRLLITTTSAEFPAALSIHRGIQLPFQNQDHLLLLCALADVLLYQANTHLEALHFLAQLIKPLYNVARQQKAF